MGTLGLKYYAARPWDGGGLVVETALGGECARYGAAQRFDLYGFLSGRGAPAAEAGEWGLANDAIAAAAAYERSDEAMARLAAVLEAREAEDGRLGYCIGLTPWQGGLSVDFCRTRVCADLLFVLLQEGCADAEEVAGFVEAIRAHATPTYLKWYILAKWAQAREGAAPEAAFAELYLAARRECPERLTAESDWLRGGGVAFSRGGHHFFAYPAGEREIVYRYEWQPQSPRGYSVEYGAGGRLIKLDGRRVPPHEAKKLLAAGIDGRYAARHRLRCFVEGGKRLYKILSGELVAEGPDGDIGGVIG